MSKLWIYALLLCIIVTACSDDTPNAPGQSDESDIIEIIEISSSENSSSSLTRPPKAAIYFSYKAEEKSSSSIISSSSIKELSSSSQPKSSAISSSIESSSSAQSSSSNAPKSSVSLRFYNCEEYDCVSTDYLNPNITYGELLDKRDNQVYRTLVISNNVWMAQNINFEIDSNSDSQSWCYNDDPEYCKKFGRLYNWEAAQKVCPEGWHLPTVEEWLELIEEHTCEITQEGDFPNQYHCAGTSLKTVDGWEDGLTNTNEYGFSVMATGFKVPKGFGGEGVMGEFWTSTDETETYAAFVEFGRVQDYAEFAITDKTYGFSARCIKGYLE